eukprot:scaffold40866_cov44-Phaeocystis_antarctica.AAC.1
MEKHGQTAVTSAALEAASSGTRGTGGASSGTASSWECRAAQSRQARPEEAQEPSGGPAQERGGCTLSMRPCEGHACDERDAPLRGDHAEGEALHLVRVKGYGLGVS